MAKTRARCARRSPPTRRLEMVEQRFTKERLDAGLQSGIDEAIAKAFAHHLKCTDAIVNQGIKIQTIIFPKDWEKFENKLYRFL
jgi:hypothetical protein